MLSTGFGQHVFLRARKASRTTLSATWTPETGSLNLSGSGQFDA
jgi:hypothetical protein